MNPTSDSVSSYETLLHNKIRSYGFAQGKAECILETLSDYGPVPPRIEEQIRSQRDCGSLDRWFTLARQVHSVDAFVNRM